MTASLFGLLLQPHVRARILGDWGRAQRFREFVSETQQRGSIDPRGFWEFREKYSPGSFSFDRGVEHLGTQVIQELPEAGQPLHTFTGSRIVSKDFVVRKNENHSMQEKFQILLDENIPERDQANPVFSSPTERIYRDRKGVAFAKPLEELIQSDGLFDFTDAERKRLENHFWINLTILE